MTKTISAASMAMLASIVKATEAGGFAYHAPSDVVELVNAGLAEQNPGVKNSENETQIATRATDEGLSFTAPSVDAETTAEAAKPVIASGSFALGGIKKAVRKAPTRTSQYPFDDIPAPNPADPDDAPGFFVAKTDKMKEPWKSLASAVSNYNRKHGVITGTEEREVKGEKKTFNTYDFPTVKFEIARYEHNGVEGALVYRVK